MSEKNMKENLQSFAVKKVLDYMEGDLDKNLPKLLEWADKFDKENLYASQRKVFHDILEHPDNNWYQMIKSLWTDIDPEAVSYTHLILGGRHPFAESFCG